MLIAMGKRNGVYWILTAQPRPSVLAPVVIVVAWFGASPQILSTSANFSAAYINQYGCFSPIVRRSSINSLFLFVVGWTFCSNTWTRRFTMWYFVNLALPGFPCICIMIAFGNIYDRLFLSSSFFLSVSCRLQLSMYPREFIISGLYLRRPSRWGSLIMVDQLQIWAILSIRTCTAFWGETPSLSSAIKEPWIFRW